MALRHLSLRDFVIVASLELDLHGGFTVLTGETGAGKSILLDALQLLLGARADALWVREGRPRCELSAEFDTPPAARAWLAEQGLDAPGQENGGDSTLLLRRSIDAAGKSRAWVNGVPATVAQLKTLGEWLVDIHGQHAWQGLMRPAAVRALLDAYASADARPTAAAWQHWQQAKAALQQARTAQDSLAQERDRLLWQIGEVEKLAPAEGEWDEINQQHTRLSNAQALIDAARTAYEALDGGHHDAIARLGRALGALQAHAAIEPEFAAHAQVLESCIAQAQDAAHGLQGWLRRSGPDPQQLAALDERMGLWLSLARRYRRQPQDLPALLAGWRADLARLENAADLDALQHAERQAHAAYGEAARALSAQRAAAAPRLAAAVTAAMQTLGMAGGRFAVALEALPEPAAHGLESAAFQVAAHAGATPRAIDRVASGGELSRLALAIAVTTSALGEAGTLVFDEVDSGVGGAVATTVGQLLRQLGRDRQVLCVTHLPQVAACGDHHLHVSKQASPANGAPSAAAQAATTSQVQPITGDAREREIARMLAGEPTSATSLAHAREMLAAPHAASAADAPAPATPAPAAATPATATTRRSKSRTPDPGSDPNRKGAT